MLGGGEEGLPQGWVRLAADYLRTEKLCEFPQHKESSRPTGQQSWDSSGKFLRMQ